MPGMAEGGCGDWRGACCVFPAGGGGACTLAGGAPRLQPHDHCRHVHRPVCPADDNGRARDQAPQDAQRRQFGHHGGDHRRRLRDARAGPPEDSETYVPRTYFLASDQLPAAGRPAAHAPPKMGSDRSDLRRTTCRSLPPRERRPLMASTAALALPSWRRSFCYRRHAQTCCSVVPRPACGL